MRIKSFLLLALFAFLSQTLNAQEETVLGRRGFGFSGVWGGYHHQMARFGNSNSYINGGFFGLEFGKSFLIGINSYELTDKVTWDNITNQNFDMRYRGLSIGYGFNNHKAVHPMLQIDLAPGKVSLTNEGSDRVFVVQPSAGIEINVLRWMHLGLTGGYRFVSDSSLPSLNDKDLSGVYGQLAFKFGWSWGRSNRKTPKKFDN